MPLTLVWGKGFEFKSTALSTGGTYQELFGVEGDSAGINWRSLRDMIAVAAKYGVPEDLWPVYSDCSVDSDVPLHEVWTKSAQLRCAIAKIPADVVAQDYWLPLISEILRDGHLFFVMA